MSTASRFAIARYIVLALALASASPTPVWAQEEDNTALLKEAAGQMKAGEYQEALDLYLDAIENDSEDWRPYQGAGNAYRKMGNDERALEYYKEALDAKGEDAELEKKIEDMESAAEEADEPEREGLKPLRGAETSNMAMNVKNRPQPVSAAGSFILLGYGTGFPPNGKVFKAHEAVIQGMDSGASASSIPFGVAGDLTYAFVGKKTSRIGFRAQGSYGIAKLWSIYASQYDYTNNIDWTWDDSFLFTEAKFSGDILVRLGKSAFFYAGAAYNSVKLKWDFSYSDYYFGFDYDRVIIATASGAGPRFGFVLLGANKKGFGFMGDVGYEISTVTNFRGQSTGDFVGDVAIGVASNGQIGYAPGKDLPSGVEELKFHPGGFWFKFGIGINFGRPAVVSK